MTVKLVGSTSGSVSLQAPASTTGGAHRVLTLPDADGTVAVGDTGKILQHSIISKNDQSSITGTTPTAIPNFSITITPTASDSIMVVEANMFLSNSGHVICSRIYNGTSFLISPNSFPTSNNQNGTSSIYHGSGEYMEQQHLMAFETSGNTNARTYSLYWNVTGGTGYINRWHGSSIYHSVSTFRVTEIAA